MAIDWTGITTIQELRDAKKKAVLDQSGLDWNKQEEDDC